MTIQETIQKLIDREDLSRDEAASVMRELMSGECTPAQIAGFLVALRMKGETVDEITGLATTMRSLATTIETSRRPLVDTCGTGGDASGTFNISTTAAFVVAGAGVAVAKHGNRSASSLCGSADVLEALGVNLDVSAEAVGKSIDDIGVGFLFARALHGAMKHVAGPRTELKIRTVFNILGPLTNPAGATGQVMGVFDASLVEDLARVLGNLGAERAFVVAGLDGLDEITLNGPSRIAETKNGELSTYEIRPSDFGIDEAPSSALKGGTAEENAAILRSVLKGEAGPRRDVVLLNAAAALQAGNAADGWESGIAAARTSIDSGKALEALDGLVRLSNA